MGTKFIPTPKAQTANIIKDLDTFKRRIRIKNQFSHLSDDPSFIPKFTIPKSSFTPSSSSRIIERYLSEVEHNTLSAISKFNDVHYYKKNLSSSQLKFLQSIRSNPLYIIKPTDKNLGLALMNRSWYNGEILRQLSDTSTYREVASSAIDTQSIYNSITSTCKDALKHEFITKQMYEFICLRITPSTCQVPQIYILPKVHKAKLAGRPIVPGINWITTPASILIDHLLQPLSKLVPTILSDSKSLIVSLRHKSFDQHINLVTADVSSLYTEIEINKGIAFIQQVLREHPSLFPPQLASFITSLLRIVMQNNYLQFDNKYYHQIKGTAMGTPTAVIFANIFLFILERKVLARFHSDILFYKRYLDDIFLVASDFSPAMEHAFQSMEKSIRLEFTTSKQEVTFLDIVFFKGPQFHATGILDTKTHQKQLNKYLYIPYSSSHTLSSKKGFITSELRRYIRNTSSIHDYIQLKVEFFKRLRARGYPSSLLSQLFSTVRYSERDQLLLPSIKKTHSNHEVYFTTELTPLTQRLNFKEILNSKYLLDIDIVPQMGFKSTSSLLDIMCANKLPSTEP